MNSKSRYKDETLKLAVQLYQNREYPSIRSCAKAYGISESTLWYRLQNKQNMSTEHANKQLLSLFQEQILVQ